MSNNEYWLVAKRNDVASFGQVNRSDDYLMLIAIPYGIRRGLSYSEITLKDLDDLQNSVCDQNVFLNVDYAPFQRGQTFYYLYKGFPVSNVKQFLTDALNLKSNDFYEYKKLVETNELVSNEQ